MTKFFKFNTGSSESKEEILILHKLLLNTEGVQKQAKGRQVGKQV
jgi:hypothetical protein